MYVAKSRIALAMALSAASLSAYADCDLRFAPPDVRAMALAHLSRHAPAALEQDSLAPDDGRLDSGIDEITDEANNARPCLDRRDALSDCPVR